MTRSAILCAATGWLLLCTTLAVAKKRPAELLPMSVDQAVLCQDVERKDNLLEPIGAAEVFSASDQQVTGFVRFRNVLQPHTLRWAWYDPDGALYVDSPELNVTPTAPYHDFYTASHAILLKGERAALRPGTWKVVVYVDKSIAVSRSFSLTSARTEP